MNEQYEKSLSKLELDKVLSLLADQASSTPQLPMPMPVNTMTKASMRVRICFVRFLFVFLILFLSFLSLVFRFEMAQPDCLTLPCDYLCKHSICVVVLLFCRLLLAHLPAVFLMTRAFFFSSAFLI